MAVPDFTLTANLPGKSVMHTWVLTTADHTGAGMEHPGGSDRTITASGTWGGATAAIQGGDAVTYISLTDPQGNAISKTSDAIEVVTEIPEFTRPNLTTAGSGATITCTMIMRKGFRK